MTQHQNNSGRDDADWLDALLDDVGQSQTPDAPTALMMRVLADAEAVQPAPGGARQAPGQVLGLWRQVLDGLGGWLPACGVVAATATGFVIGLGGLSGVGFDPLQTYDPEAASVFVEDGLSANGWFLEEG